MTVRIKILLFSTLFLLASCTEKKKSEGTINYESLPDISTEKILEFGESEQYLPGQLSELFISPEGAIIISDWGSNTIEQFSADGRHLATVATEGEGPGELTNFFFIADLGNGQFMVEQQGSRRDLFEPGEDGIYRYRHSVTADRGDTNGYHILGTRSEGEYYATPRIAIRNVMELVQNPIDYFEHHLVVVDIESRVLADSLHRMQNPYPHIERIGQGFRVEVIPYRNIDRALVLPDHTYIIATPHNGLIQHFGPDHSLLNEFTLEVNPRPVTGDDLDYHFRNTDREMRRAVEPRVDQYKPLFLELWATESHLWLHTDNSEHGRKIVVLDRKGNQTGRFYLHEYTEIRKITGNKIYAFHKDPDVGHTIRIYRADI